MSWRTFVVIISTLILSGCGSEVTQKGPQQLNLEIKDTSIESSLVSTASEQLDVFVKNSTAVNQMLKIQGLKINFVSQPLLPESNQTLHFQIDKNKGAVNITATDSNNKSQSTTVTIN